MTLPIRTKRLRLRRFTRSDKDDLLDLVSHPSVARATPEIKPTESGAHEYIDRQNEYKLFERDKCFDLAIQHNDSGRMIGLLTLVTRDHRLAEIGWALNYDFRGRGYATEAAAGLIRYAFSELKLHRVQASTTSANPESVRVMERLGMRHEARLVEAVYLDDRWVDGLIFGLLAAEHENGTSTPASAPDTS